ncbi:MAG: hypothetical protein MN733_42625 [Nitrososphaera sp.]|nr:hypothetical protein [Nitrososphaera sp.]
MTNETYAPVFARIWHTEVVFLGRQGYSVQESYQNIADRYGQSAEYIREKVEAIDAAKRRIGEFENLSYDELLNADPKRFGWNSITELLLDIADIQGVHSDVPGELEEDEVDQFLLDHPERTYESRISDLVKRWKERGIL